MIAAGDFETDPFEVGIIPAPFVCGFYSPIHGYFTFWGDDCAKQFVRFLDTLDEPHLIYFHNGGKFDFFFLLDWAEGDMRIINSRIAEMRIGKHTFRDSFAAIPARLADFDKGDIDIQLMHKSRRDAARDEILIYLERDVKSLHTLITAFTERFGRKLTIGGAAIAELMKLHPFDRQGESHDSRFRPYYFGGRVQCFEGGVIRGKFKVADINSAYPFTMAHYSHPCGRLYTSPSSPRISAEGNLVGYGERFYFATVRGSNRGAFPLRVTEGPRKGSLDWDSTEGVYHVTCHEMRVALKYGLFDIKEVIAAEVAHEEISFREFVEQFMRDKIAAEEAGDKGGRLFAKLISNNGYGKAAQNPDNFRDYKVVRSSDERPDGGEIDFTWGDIDIYGWPSENKSYYDVAIAASITGATRAYLLEALCNATRPLYCDTDSLICEELAVEMHPTKLGAWKYEGSGDCLYIGGKKLYALFDGDEPVKWASKGVRLTPQEIAQVASGTKIDYTNIVPTFSLSNYGKFVSRSVRKNC